jgi:hypothetical protein
MSPSKACFRFIQRCPPQRTQAVPAGDNWQHEIKFAGFRVQNHKLDDEVELNNPSGSRFGRRFPLLCKVIGELPVRSAIIDGEIVASDAAGMHDFWPLVLRFAKPAQLRVWSSISWPSTVKTCGDGHWKTARVCDDGMALLRVRREARPRRAGEQASPYRSGYAGVGKT